MDIGHRQTYEQSVASLRADRPGPRRTGRAGGADGPGEPASARLRDRGPVRRARLPGQHPGLLAGRLPHRPRPPTRRARHRSTSGPTSPPAPTAAASASTPSSWSRERRRSPTARRTSGSTGTSARPNCGCARCRTSRRHRSASSTSSAARPRCCRRTPSAGCSTSTARTSTSPRTRRSASRATPARSRPQKLELLAELGCTKLSSGVQSFDDPVLEQCGREHTAQMCVDFVRNAQRIGFEWISIDLMYGLLDQSVDSVRRDLDIVARERTDRRGLHEAAPEVLHATPGRASPA